MINALVGLIDSWGYFGIFMLMALESSFIPFPSEVVMIPAGYLVFKGSMNLWIAFISGVAGSLAGAVFNYYLCYFFGRPIIRKYGKFVGINDKKFKKFENFFRKHGEISTFNCRLLPGIRQYISLPAGLAKMNIFKFCIFTSLGAGIWVAVLMATGYVMGQNETQIKAYMHTVTTTLVMAVLAISAIYIIKNK